jgi:hypothetical protein
MALNSAKISLEEQREIEEPIEQVLSKGHGEVIITVKITDHKIVHIGLNAQYEMRNIDRKDSLT